VKRSIIGVVLALSLFIAPLASAQTPAIPIGVSLSTHITLGTNLIPENSLIPEAPATTTPNAPTTTAFLIQSLYAEIQTLEAQIAVLQVTASTGGTSGDSVSPTTPRGSVRIDTVEFGCSHALMYPVAIAGDASGTESVILTIKPMLIQAHPSNLFLPTIVPVSSGRWSFATSTAGSSIFSITVQIPDTSIQASKIAEIPFGLCS
jgi:hypothetical protein